MADAAWLSLGIAAIPLLIWWIEGEGGWTT